MLARCYKKKKERLQKRTCKRYQDVAEDEKKRMQQYVCRKCKNLPKDDKLYLAEYRKK